MAEEKLNNDLKNRIREVFDNYEDTGADEGWLLLRQKFPVKEKDRGLAWLWYAAAAVVLLASAIWLIPKANKTQPVIAHIQKPVANPGKKDNIQAPLDTISRLTHNITQAKQTERHRVTNPTSVTIQPNLATVKSTNITQPGPAVSTIKQDGNIIAPAADPSKNMATNTATNQPYLDTAKHTVPNATLAQFAPPMATEPKKSIYDLLAEKSNNEDKQTKKTGNKPIISVYAATYFNYAKGSDNQVNLGAGFTSDFHITNKLKLSTGLAIAQNKLNYSNGTEPNAQQHEAAFASLAASVAKANGSPITGNGSMQSLAAFATNLGGTKNYSASLVGLDIPVNLKFEFNPQKSDAYVSAGVSSGTFINETYREIYSYSQVSKENATHNSFSNFDIAKTLNFSFGVGYPLGKSNRLIVEPFFKYPLDGLGQQQIRFGAGGVNLKLNFRSLKK